MENRKKDHINLAFESQIPANVIDERFFYEPMLSAHPVNAIPETDFLGKRMKLPVWVSSMTGGTKMAGIINRNLARASREFGLGMGLGSCRILLDDDTYFPDFDMRDIMGPEQPLWANLGINQLEDMLRDKQVDRIIELVEKLRADGLFIHVNPFQEWFQPEGDRLKKSPIESIQALLGQIKFPVIVKEVGQGMGYESLRQLLRLPLGGIEFAAFGGTNFAKVELLRTQSVEQEMFEPLTRIGHDALQMVNMVNHIVENEPENVRVRQLIISGGVRSYLDGYYLIHKSKIPAVYGQASSFLKYASDDYETLQQYIRYQVKGLQIAFAYLRVR